MKAVYRREPATLRFGRTDEKGKEVEGEVLSFTEGEETEVPEGFEKIVANHPELHVVDEGE